MNTFPISTVKKMLLASPEIQVRIIDFLNKNPEKTFFITNDHTGLKYFAITVDRVFFIFEKVDIPAGMKKRSLLDNYYFDLKEISDISEDWDKDGMILCPDDKKELYLKIKVLDIIELVTSYSISFPDEEILNSESKYLDSLGEVDFFSTSLGYITLSPSYSFWNKSIPKDIEVDVLIRTLLDKRQEMELIYELSTGDSHIQVDFNISGYKGVYSCTPEYVSNLDTSKVHWHFSFIERKEKIKKHIYIYLSR